MAMKFDAVRKGPIFQAWLNHHRLLEPIGNRPPAEAEAIYHRQLAESAMPA